MMQIEQFVLIIWPFHGSRYRDLGISLEVALDQVFRHRPEPFGQGTVARLG